RWATAPWPGLPVAVERPGELLSEIGSSGVRNASRADVPLTGAGRGRRATRRDPVCGAVGGSSPSQVASAPVDVRGGPHVGVSPLHGEPGGDDEGGADDA